MPLKLTPRLEKIVEMVPKGSKVADIGTDHGYIPIYLVENGYSQFVIAGDINPMPLKSAKKNIQLYGYEKKIETRLGSGLQILKPKEVETVILAGMGGRLIIELLEVCPEIANTVENFILQPMQAQEELRRYLIQNGFQIVRDELVKEEHHIYEVIMAQKGFQEIKEDIYYEIGFFIETNPTVLAIEFLERKINILKEIMNQVHHIQSVVARKKYNECMKKIIKMEEVLICLKK